MFSRFLLAPDNTDDSFLTLQAKSELQIKRREEKELRHSEKQHLEQINSLEIDVAKVERSLEKSRESYTALKNNYDEECSEAASLRGLLAAARGVSFPSILGEWRN